MFKRGERLLSVLIAFLMILNTASISVASEIGDIFDETQSGWAETELKQAHSLELTYPGVMNNYRKNITREEFSTLAVKMHEAFTAKKATTAKNPFLDTNNEEVLKAYNLGIVKGISTTEFAPKKDITRQEICVMIYRALEVSLDKLTEDKTLELPFSDKDNVASWAMKEVRFAYTYSIMKGMGNNKLEPLLNTTREQAIVLMKRTYSRFYESTDGGTNSGVDGFEIALITDKGNINDKSFNQGAWEGLVEFAEAEGISHTYIKPEEASEAGCLAAIDLAVTGGAKVIVTPGFLFEVPIYKAQTKYPDVKFILLDGAPHTADYATFETKENVASIFYAEQEAGYLAGYAAVKEGMTDLGFMGGMAVPSVQAFGYGYLQGAEMAATELGMADASVEVTYHYTGNFEENDNNKATAKTMFQEGVEVIFACGGSVGKSVMSAAAELDGKVIGVDVDQRYDSETVITSATKGLAASVIAVLKSIYKTDSWADYSAKTTIFNAANNGIGLPTIVIGDEDADAFDRFENFTKADYDAAYAKLLENEGSIIREIDVADYTGAATAVELTEQLGLNKVIVTTR